MMRPSLRTRLVREEASTKTDGSTRPHTAMIPKGAGSSMNLVISKPVRSSIENNAPKTCRSIQCLLQYCSQNRISRQLISVKAESHTGKASRSE